MDLRSRRSEKKRAQALVAACRMGYTQMASIRLQRSGFECLLFLLTVVVPYADALAEQAQSAVAPASSLCTMTVQLPAASARGQAPPAGAAGAGRGGARGAGAVPDAAAQPAGLPKLVKVNDGVILFDSKNEQMHDDIVSKVRSLTDKPIKYVVLTHNHGDHSGGSAKMQQIGATVLISEEDRQNMQRGNQPGLPQITYHQRAQIFLGGKEVQLREFCGHTDGDTVAYLPAPRVMVVGDLVTTPDTIPQIVNYGDRGNWTDMGKTLDEIAKMDFDFLIGGHGPVLTKQEFLKHRDKVAATRERLRELNRQGKSQEEITQTLLKEFNWGTGPAAGNISGMMLELR